MKDWYDKLKGIVLKDAEPASRSYRYMARLIEKDFVNEGGPGVCLAFSAPDADRLSTHAILMLSYCLQSELDARVLAVDARTRQDSPGITQRLGLEGASGFTNSLGNDKESVASQAKPTAVQGVDVLPVGTDLSSTSATVNSQRLGEFIDTAKSEYDFVLMQVGSILTDTRSLVVSRATDSVMLLVEEYSTLMKSLDESQKVLHDNGVADAGIVVMTAE